MISVLPSLVILGLVAVAALELTRARESPDDLVDRRRSAARALSVAVVIQSTHFVEEWATGFHIRFPALLGLEPMPLSFFVTFNLAWIALWIASVPWVRASRPTGFFAAWFLALAGILNGIAHPVMAFVSGGYFPGLFSAPVIAGAAIVLFQRLRSATR